MQDLSVARISGLQAGEDVNMLCRLLLVYLVHFWCILEMSMGKHMEPNKVQRISLNLTQRDLVAIEALARAEGTNRTIAIQRAIQAKKFLREALDEGGKVLIQRKDSSLVEVVFQ